MFGLKNNGFTLLCCPQGHLEFFSAAQPCGGCGNIDQKTRCGKYVHAELEDIQTGCCLIKPRLPFGAFQSQIPQTRTMKKYFGDQTFN